MPPNPCSKVDRTSFSALSRSAAVRPTPGPTTQPGARATHIANPAPRTADPSSAAVMIATERQARMRLPPPSGHKRTYPGFADGWSPLQGSTTRTRGSGADSIPGLCRPRSNRRDNDVCSSMMTECDDWDVPPGRPGDAPGSSFSADARPPSPESVASPHRSAPGPNSR